MTSRREREGRPSKARRAHKVKETAGITGVSIRTLHYYDEIGLLTPSDRMTAGYRLYTDEDLLRLQQILIGRSLGMSLEEIRRSLDDPDFDHARALRDQRALLLERLTETHKMIAAIDTTLNNLESSAQEIDFKAIFDGFDPRDHEDEARERWGETYAYAQHAARTKDYTEAEWRALKAELDAIWSDAAEAMRAGAAPDSAAALGIVERHRRHVSRWFYDLTPEMHARLADMWEGDARFAENIDKGRPGLTAWLVPAVRAASNVE